ncbi:MULTISPECIES: hypothetical protein [unclassified Pseudomonas]|uniref:hypothetical protein n=1 Tax=unclassified Pseudomonas TaxID=196821 RepID=UPI001476747F|nr:MULTISPECIES: hypothetical protein [unclassified Pseudomonas]MBJ2241271.1 hypothetical protein [Pseudomonas sp. MF6768]NMY23784.1 hypothetical protein [Pseudomonas sp. WS 5410]
MKTIRALRQFSHYHAGHFDQFEERPVTDEIAEALIGMDLAEEVEAAPAPKEKSVTVKKAKAT